jgi:hypothetical protein
MRRVGRYILNVLTVLSLVLCVATAALWVRSYDFADYAYYTIPEEGRSFETAAKESRTYGVLQRAGVVQLDYLRNSRLHGYFIGSPRWSSHCAGRCDWGSVYIGDRDGRVDFRFGFPVPRGGVAWRDPPREWHGFGHGTGHYDDWGMWASPTPAVCHFVTLPHWALTAAFAALPTMVGLARVRRRRRRDRVGHCGWCGYDLRATPERCPECGTIPTKAKA